MVIGCARLRCKAIGGRLRWIARAATIRFGRRSALWTVALVLSSGGCTGTPVPPPDPVIAWLGQSSYFDKWGGWRWSRRAPAAQGKDWIVQGRAISGAAAKLETLLANRDSRVELPQVAFALGYLGRSESLPVLMAALDSPDFYVRMEAAASLGRLDDERAIGPLCHVLANDQDSNVRGNAALSLGRIKAPERQDEVRACLGAVLRAEESASQPVATAPWDTYLHGFVVDCVRSALGELDAGGQDGG